MSRNEKDVARQGSESFPYNIDISKPLQPPSSITLPRSETENKQGKSSHTMAAQFDPWAEVFDLSREYILSHPTPPIQIADSHSASTTRSTHRLHWNGIALWADFGDLVHQYWNNVVTQDDKQTYVFDTGAYRQIVQGIATDTRVSNEGNVKVCIDAFPVVIHSAAANGRNGAPRPSDRHSKLERWGTGIEGNGVAGIPDFVMATEILYFPRRITAMIEVKNPWLVTPALIDNVINDQVPLAGVYPARLAVEQLYGYMVRNSKVFGILSTMKGWCFLRRINGGGLYISRMYGDFQARQGVSPGAAAEGYYPTTNFTIMQALYYMSYIAESTGDLPETPVNGVPGQVFLPNMARDSTAAAPLIRQPPPILPMPASQGGGYGYGYYGGYQGIRVMGGYETAECSRYHNDVDYSSLQFEPWNQKNCLGPKTWIATVISDKSKVVLKLWDAWIFDTDHRDHEASVYVHLKSLWGLYIPSLRMSTPLEFFHALILQYVNAYPVSSLNLTGKIERKILMAFDAIHSHGVVHGDIRSANILVDQDGKSVWVIDFEFAEILTDGSDDKEVRILQENEEVQRLLREIKSTRDQMASC